MACFEHFLKVILTNKELILSPELESFLSYDALEIAKTNSKNLYRVINKPESFYTGKGKSQQLENITTSTGEAQMKMDTMIRKQSRELSLLINKVTPMEEKAAKICKDIVHHMKQITVKLQELANQTSYISESYISSPLSTIGELYDSIKNSFRDWAHVVNEDADNFNENIHYMFLFSNQEKRGLRDLIETRNGFSKEYKKRKIALELKKEKAFPSMNIKQWDMKQDEIPVSIQILLQDKNECKKYMFPKV